MKSKPDVQIVGTGDDIFVVVDGVRIAKRGRSGTRHARTWISLEPGWVVTSPSDHTSITITYNGQRIQ
jgi:hypothetical protein